MSKPQSKFSSFLNAAFVLAALVILFDFILPGHIYKEKVVEVKEGDTVLTLKELAPVRLIKNAFYQELEKAYLNGAGKEELKDLLGRGRAKKGMFEGELEEGELEIGQVSGMINSILPAKTILNKIIDEYNEALKALSKYKQL